MDKIGLCKVDRIKAKLLMDVFFIFGCVERIKKFSFRNAIIVFSFTLIPSMTENISISFAANMITSQVNDYQGSVQEQERKIPDRENDQLCVDRRENGISDPGSGAVSFLEGKSLWKPSFPNKSRSVDTANSVTFSAENRSFNNVYQLDITPSFFGVLAVPSEPITASATITSTSTSTATNIPTSSSTSTVTKTPEPTKSATITLKPTKTTTATPSKSPTWTLTSTRTPFPSPVTPTYTPTVTPTITASATFTPTNTQTPTATLLPLPTLYYTIEPPATATPTTPTPTAFTIPSITPNGLSRAVDSIFDTKNALRTRLFLLVFALWATVTTGIYFYIRRVR